MRRLAIIAAVLATASCATKMELPVVGRTSTGEAVHGTATASLEGPGTFEVFTASGVRCFGTYDDQTRSTTLIIPVKCSDGRTGNVISTRDPTLIRGTASAQLDDGTTAEFIYGRISAQDQAAFLAHPPPPAAAKPQAPAARATD